MFAMQHSHAQMMGIDAAGQLSPADPCCGNCSCRGGDPCCGDSSARARMMARLTQHRFTSFGQATDPSVTQQVTQSVADRIAAIRAKMVKVGIPAAVGSGVLTMFVSAGAFGLARTERVWTPSIFLGGVATLAGLVATALAAKIAKDVATEQATAPVSTTPATATAPIVDNALPTTDSGVTVEPASVDASSVATNFGYSYSRAY